MVLTSHMATTWIANRLTQIQTAPTPSMLRLYYGIGDQDLKLMYDFELLDLSELTHTNRLLRLTYEQRLKVLEDLLEEGAACLLTNQGIDHDP